MGSTSRPNQTGGAFGGAGPGGRGDYTGPEYSGPGGGGGAGGGGLSQIVQIQLPEDSPIPSAEYFNTENNVATTLAQSGVEVPGSGVDLPANSIGRLAAITFEVQGLLPASDIHFHATVNNSPIPGFDDYKVFPANLAEMAKVFPVKIMLPAGGRLRLFFDNIDGNSYIIGGGFYGWFWNKAAGTFWILNGRKGY